MAPLLNPLRFLIGRFLLGWALLWGVYEPQTQVLDLGVSQDNRLILRAPETAPTWFRLEQTSRFEGWVPLRDSFAWPTALSLDHRQTAFRFYQLIPVPIPEPPYTIGVVGDSTAVGIERFPRVGGWAQRLSTFAREDTRFVMAGEPGLSTKSFFGSFRERMLTTTTPTLVMVQLGQIDEFNGQPEVKSTTLAEYRDHLMAMIEMIRGWGGIPMLVTPLPSREFSADGVLAPYLVERSAEMRSLGEEAGVWVIDLHQLVSDLYLAATPEDLDHWGYADHYHLSIPGSLAVAELALQALPSHLSQLLFQFTPDP